MLALKFEVDAFIQGKGKGRGKGKSKAYVTTEENNAQDNGNSADGRISKLQTLDVFAGCGGLYPHALFMFGRQKGSQWFNKPRNRENNKLVMKICRLLPQISKQHDVKFLCRSKVATWNA